MHETSRMEKIEFSPSKVKAPAQLSLSSASYPPPDLNDIELELQEELERDKTGLGSVEPVVDDISVVVFWAALIPRTMR